MLWAEGPGKRNDVFAFYLAKVRKTDPSASIDASQDWRVVILSRTANAMISVFQDGNTCNAQITYGAY